ncbi:Eco57I restriction-modification methylase domain-containing protein [Rhodococcus zopfii]|uniref:Eco57I restriction-modification methylase domain-containing protein n=1 Tax=Rhodococcus zopfii TaxID=43772 RepID=UPI0035283B2E
MSAVTHTQVFSAVHTVGGLLPADMLVRIAEDKDVSGCKPADYRVVVSRSVHDEAERHWDYLRSVWTELRNRLPVAPESDVPIDATGVAIRQWLIPLFAELGFGELTAVGASGILSDDGSKAFAISHRWTHVPVHLTAWHISLDRRPDGAGTLPAQSLLQDCLNRTEAHLWGIVSNGRQLRLLRDSNALATAAYVEFDLESIFDGELFSDFLLLYRLLHVTRFAVSEDAPPASCWLEKWRNDAIDSGARALEQLRDGVQAAITALGTGFLRHPDNASLRENIDVATLHTALLRLVYRMLFLFVTEDRNVLHHPDAGEQERERYAAYFSTRRLRAHARRRRGTTHSDLFQGFRIVLEALGDERGRPELGLPGLGGIFDNTSADDPLRGLSLSNAYFLKAVRHLSEVRDSNAQRRRTVDYRHLGAEELGSIYESLLELIPRHSATERRFELVNAAGNTRKTTGSYYTPSPLIECALNSALDPVIDAAVKRGEQIAVVGGHVDPAESIVRELLTVTVCDPASGSGHFLVAAARRIAKRVAAVREGNPEPTVDAVRRALHEVIARCIYGVDLNPMAVELAKVSLWLEALEPGKPLGFLDAHIKCGNALIGATPQLLRDGIPNKAFKAVEGDDASYANFLLKQNEQERSGQIGLFDVSSGTKVANTSFAASLSAITTATADTLGDVRRQAVQYRAWEDSDDYRHALHVADAWCAAILWRKRPDAPSAITHEAFQALQDPEVAAVPQETLDEISRLRDQYKFLHWHLTFPEIFSVPEDGEGVDPATGWAGGFSCVLGNPPWDKVDFEDKKYFSVVEPSIAALTGAARRTRIEEWTTEYPDAGESYRAARRQQKASFHFAGDSGAFPLCAKGLTVKGVNSLQTDHLFAEKFTTIVAPAGRIGCIIPSTIATGAGAQHLFADLSSRGAVTLLYDFENRKPIFEGVHAGFRFCLLSLVGRELREPEAKFAFFLLDVTDLEDSDRIFALSPEEIGLINPNTGTLPIFRNRRDADLTASIQHRIPVLWNEKHRNGNPWGITFKRLFDMTDDSDLFRTRKQLEDDGWDLEGNIFVRDGKRMLPLYEAKMVDFYNHRAADVVKSETAVSRQNQPRYLTPAELRDPDRYALPLNWIADEGLIATRRKGKDFQARGVALRLDEIPWDREWLCGWCDVTSSTNERTAIPAIIPRTAVGHTFPLMLPRVSPELMAALIAAQSSLVFDFVSRQKVGGAHMAVMTWKQLPVPSPQSMEGHTEFVTPRVLELVFTAHDMAGFARDLGDNGLPFQWNDERRAQVRAELDAYFFHLYGIARDDVTYILESFQSQSGGGLKNNEIAKYGTYRTKDLVLAAYDRMGGTDVSLDVPLVDGENYTSVLNPLPGQGARVRS